MSQLVDIQFSTAVLIGGLMLYVVFYDKFNPPDQKP